MLTKSQRTGALEILRTMKTDLLLLLESLSGKDDELSKLEACDETCAKTQLISAERRLRIESLVYDIISGKDVPFLDNIHQLTEMYFDEPIPKESTV